MGHPNAEKVAKTPEEVVAREARKRERRNLYRQTRDMGRFFAELPRPLIERLREGRKKHGTWEKFFTCLLDTYDRTQPPPVLPPDAMEAAAVEAARAPPPAASVVVQVQPGSMTEALVQRADPQ